MSDLRAELAESLDEAEWAWLEPHAKRDSIIVVSQALNLLDVGEALANNNVAAVQSWIQATLLEKPSPDQLSSWNQNRQKRFHALIVQPYVLVQELAA